MIALLRGLVASRGDDYAVLDVGGVGYLVHVSTTTAARLAPAQEVQLHIHTAVREDAIQLFGFSTTIERDVFLKLNTVTGIGPKLGMAVLSGASIEELIGAVADGNVKRLTQIPGVGKKTAERMLVELQETFRALRPTVPTIPGKPPPDASLGDVRSALGNLGFKQAQVDRALELVAEMPNRPKDFDGLLREALRRMAG